MATSRVESPLTPPPRTWQWRVDLITVIVLLHAVVLLATIVGLLAFGHLNAQRLVQIKKIIAAPPGAPITAVEPSSKDEPDSDGTRLAPPEAAEQLPVSSERRTVREAEMTERSRVISARLEDERAQLRKMFQEVEQDLAEREFALAAREEAFAATLAAENARRHDEQFAKTVRLFQTAQPRLVRPWLIEMIATDGEEHVLAVLNALPSASVARIFREFRSDADVEIATDLIRGLRVLGQHDLAQATPAGDLQ